MTAPGERHMAEQQQSELGISGRVGDAEQALVNHAPAGHGPTGFDPSRITEAVAGVDATLLQPIIRKAADDFYEAVLNTAQDYLRENLDWNLASHLSMLERENARMRTELWEVDRIVGGNWMKHEKRIAQLRENDTRVVELVTLKAALAEVQS